VARNGSTTSSASSARPRIWLSWEHHRRSRELSAALGTELHEIVWDAPWGLRALALSVASAALLLRRRPRTLFVQNPSIILAVVACLLRRWIGYRLIVDRHSNFSESTLADPSLRFRLFHVLSRYTIRRADLTIVTNVALKDLLESWGGRGFVLPDRLPTLSLAKPRPPADERAVVFVCSHAFDEPLADVLQAAAMLDGGCRIYVTGDSRRSDPRLVRGAPPNVSFTGFLSEADYQSLLASAEVVLALTRLPNTLLCCAYEAIALEKPLVLSNQEALKHYFRAGAIFTGHAPDELAGAIARALAEGPRLRAEVAAFAPVLRVEWEERFRELRRRAGMDRADKP
jgi:glycosyltransferase involved in cell wall biosynthesis